MKPRAAMIRWAVCLTWMALGMFMVCSVAQAARVAGEEGAKPAAPEVVKPPAGPSATSPTPVAPPQKVTPPAPAQKVVQPAPAQRVAPPGPPRKVVPPAQDRKVLPVSPPARAEQKAPPKQESTESQPAASEKPEKQEPEKRYVTIDFDNVDIELFIKFISELTGKNFVVDKAVKGKVTIISPTKISVDEAYRVFESVLEVHGFATVPSGSVIKIVSATEARAKSIETRLLEGALSSEDKLVTQLIPLKYANPDELKKLFAPLISKSSVIVSYPPTGMLIVTDVQSNIKRLMNIVTAIDVVGIGEEISVVPLEHATASIIVKSLTSVFQTQTRVRKGATPEPGIKIVADDRTNALIIAASEADAMKVRHLIGLLDKAVPRGEGDIHVYYLQNADAEDLSKVLTALPSGDSKEPMKGKAAVISKEVQIVADKATNALVITSNRDDYLILEDVIQKLDIPRRMVFLEALLMEVNVDKSFTLGVQWLFADDIGSYEGRKVAGFAASTPTTGSILPSLDATTGAVSLADGFTLGLVGEGITIGGVTFPSIGAVVQAMQTDSDIQIISTPQIMTMDNEEAEVVVATNIPFLTKQDTSQTGVDYSNYEFKDVGVTLKITPQINQERFVRLQIFEEVAQVVDQEQIGLPSTLKRQTQTTVTIKDGNTVVIAGLIDRTLTQGNYAVPCLGKIPVLSWLFKTASNRDRKTNLYFFVTPHIVENPAEAREVYELKKEEMDTLKEGSVKMYEKSGQIKEPVEVPME